MKTRTVLAAMILGIIWHFLVISNYPYDDAFIHFRIAKNFAESGAPYFNTSEPVFSTSSPIWTLVLALAFRLFGASESVARVLIVVLLLASSFLLFRVLRRKDMSVNSAILWALVPYLMGLMSTAVGLMETSLWYFALIGLIWFSEKEQTFFVGLLSALMVGMRYEFVILVLVLALAHRLTLRFLAGGALGGLALCGYLWWSFGALIPQTVKAKSIVYGQSGFATFQTYFEKNFLWSTFPFVSGAIILSVLWSFVLLTGKRRSVAVSLGIFGLILAFLYPLRGAFMFQWYWALLMTPLALSLSLELADPELSPRRRTVLIVLFVLSFSRAAADAVKDVSAVVSQRYEMVRDFVQNVRVRTYEQIGRELGRKADVSTALVASEIGAISWSFPGVVLDGVGLVSPAALKYHPMKVPEQRSAEALGAIPAGFVRENRARWIVSMPILAEEVSKEARSGRLPYHLMSEIPVFAGAQVPSRTRMPEELWGNRNIEVWERD